jgi:hypothetical protein
VTEQPAGQFAQATLRESLRFPLREAADSLRKAWTARVQFHEQFDWITWTPEGAKLGRATLLARRVRDDRVRLQALLSVAFQKRFEPSALRLLEFAEAAYEQGDIAKSARHVALARFPKFVSRADHCRLYVTAGLIDSGLLTSAELLKAYDLEERELGAIKGYDPNEPRVAPGNPGGGQWTAGGGQVGSVGSQNFDYACRVLRLDRNVASDILHAIKDAANLSGADECTFDTETGDVFHGDEHIGNLHDE